MTQRDLEPDGANFDLVTYGSMAPWLILIGLKTLLDYQRPERKPVAL
jgi:hypothetical protein